MLISVGGSVSTGSTPWIDVLSSYNDVDVISGEMRIGEAGLYHLIARIRNNENVSYEEWSKIKDDTINFSHRIPRPFNLLLSLIARTPAMPKKILIKISSYRLRYRGYENLLPGYFMATKGFFDKLYPLVESDCCLDACDRKLLLAEIVTEYFNSIKKLKIKNNSVSLLIDQLFSPKLLFHESYGPVMGELVSGVKIIVVKRDPRDHFVDLLKKKKKGYHLMSSSEAALKYVNEYKSRLDRMESMLLESDSSTIMSVWFEDLLFNFDGALSKIENFIGLGDRPSVFTKFDYNTAGESIGMYKSYSHKSDIFLIENKMRNHLYPMIT